MLVFKKFDVSVEVASAHRTSKRVEGMITKGDALVFIVIVGLSVALLSVVASLTTRAVIDVPVNGNVNMDTIIHNVD